MPEKPRVKAPKKRSAAKVDTGPDKRRLALIAGGAVTVLVLVTGAFLLLAAGGSSTSADDVRAALTAANCTFEVKPAVANISDHSDFPDPDGTSDSWNTDPPTSGPHYGTTLIYGSYRDSVQLGRVLHNLEHGAVFILFGDQAPEATIAQLQAFYDDHQNGTVLAPYATLGDQIALGAWLVEGLPEAASDRGSGVLAKCRAFDQDAFEAFFDAFQFKGPESEFIGPSDMEPGEN